MSIKPPTGRCLALRRWSVIIVLVSHVCWAGEQDLTAPDLALPVLTRSFVTTSGSYEPPPLHRLSDLRGKVVYLDFWDTACAPCRRSLSQLSELQEQLGQDVAIFSVNLNPDPRLAADFLADQSLAFEVVSDPSAASATRYGVRSLPTGVFIDRAGRLVDRHLGFGDGDISIIDARLRRLMAEQ